MPKPNLRDTEFLGRLADTDNTITKFSLDNNVRVALTRAITRLSPNDKSLQARAYNLASEQVANLIVFSRESVMNTVDVYARAATSNVLMRRLEQFQKITTDVAQSGFIPEENSDFTRGSERQPWVLDELQRTDMTVRPQALTRLSMENISRVIDPYRIAQSDIEVFSERIGMEMTAENVMTDSFQQILEKPEIIQAVNEYGVSALDVLTNSAAGSTSLVQSAITNKDSRLLEYISLSSASNVNSIPFDEIDKQLLRSMPSDISPSDDTVQRRIDSLSLPNAYTEDLYTYVLDRTYGGGIHAIARRNIARLTDGILTPLLALLGVHHSDMTINDHVHDREVGNVGIVFSIPGFSSYSVINTIKNALGIFGGNIGIVTSIDDTRTLITLPFFLYSVYIRNHISTRG